LVAVPVVVASQRWHKFYVFSFSNVG